MILLNDIWMVVDMINFIIVEDKQEHRKNHVKLITKYMMSNKLEFGIFEFDDISYNVLKEISLFNENSIYIIDLQLPSGDGLDIVRYIRNELNNWVSPIIIITAHVSLYYDVYKQRLQILDFIGKCEDIKSNLSTCIDICIKMFCKPDVYRYTYKNVDYAISFSEIDYIQREGRRTKIVAKSELYYQNISINNIKKHFPDYFIISSKGILINMKNVDKIDWNTNYVYFKDGMRDYVVSKSHKKEIDNYENN